MKITKEQVLDASVKELTFANMQISYLFSVLDEVETFTDDVLVKKVINNSKERFILDKMIHAHLLFKNGIVS